MIRIVYSYEGKEKVFETAQTEVVLGRPKRGAAVDLDLTPDPSVSRTHARIWSESGQLWIEDLGSSYGTAVNDEPIKGKGRRALRGNERVRIGDTFLTQVRFDASEAPRQKVLPREEAHHEGAQLQPGGVLEGLQPAQLAELEGCGVYLRYQDELVAAEGAELGFFFVVTRGQFAISKVNAETGKSHVIARVGAGQSFGEMSFLMGGPASANVLAVGKTVCWAIQNAALREFVQSHPGGTRLVLNIALLLARRLQEGDTKLVGVSPSLSAFFGVQARAAEARTVGAPRPAEHAEMEIPDDVFDQFVREVLNLPANEPVADVQREDVRQRIRNNEVDIVPWLDQAGHGRTLQVRLQFVEASPAPRVAVQQPAGATPRLAKPVVVHVPQTRAQVASARPVVVRPPRSLWWKIGNVAGWAGLPILAAVVVLFWLPLDSREALANSSGFQRLPLHGRLQRLLLRETTETSAVMVKTGNWYRLEVEASKPARLRTTLELEEKPSSPIRIAVRLVAKANPDTAVVDRTITGDAGQSSCELAAARLSRGSYLLECACSEQTPAAGLAARVVVTVWR
jgi:CRP-like cAMP-binding protein